MRTLVRRPVLRMGNITTKGTVDYTNLKYLRKITTSSPNCLSVATCCSTGPTVPNSSEKQRCLSQRQMVDTHSRHT